MRARPAPGSVPGGASPRWAVVLLLALAAPAHADSTSGGEEYLSTQEAVEPNVLFLIDLSSAMSDPCPVSEDCFLDEAETIPCPATTDACIDDVLDVLGQIPQHYDWARFGVVGTVEAGEGSGYYPILPLGSTATDFASALSGVSAWGEDTRNLAEAESSLAADYFENTTPDDGVDDDGDGYAPDWDEAPVEFHCQENHVIIITVERPVDDDDPNSSYVQSPLPSTDIMCDDDETTHPSGPDSQCQLDNVTAAAYDADLRADLDNDQNIVTHIVAIGLDTDTVAESLFGNAIDQTDGEGVYTIAGSADLLLSRLGLVMADIRAGQHSRSTPVLTANGDYLIYSFYEIDGSNPLAEGHVRAYTVVTDPSDPDYGQIRLIDTTGHPEEFEGAYWDAGVLLQSRPVEPSETQLSDMDGDYSRDIFTFVDELADAPSFGSLSVADRRMPFDWTFADAVASLESTYLPYFLDNADSDGDGTPDSLTYDLNDDAAVDSTDLQTLIDFARGYRYSTFRYSDIERGLWKLGDSPHSTPAVVEPRNDAFSVDPTYQTFLGVLEDDTSVPSMVYIAANDGMLHAFYLEDNATSSHTEEGEEAWAWIPSYLLFWDHETQHGTSWPGRLIDQMLYGRTFLMDGTPVVEDVWLDDGDGTRECDGDAISSVADLGDHCEWHRVLVVQQGQGGPVTLALDITDPLEPRYLWEQVDLRDPTAMGYTVGRPVIAKVYDDRDSSSPTHRWVAIWGSGRGVPAGTSVGYYQLVEPNLYMWGMGDDYFQTFDAVGFSHDIASWTNSTGYRMDDGGNNGHPEPVSYMDQLFAGGGFEDLDGHYEHAYIAATPTVIDGDNDGDADTVYFPVTTTYGSQEDSPTPQPWLDVTSQTSGVDSKDPGDTWIWKALIDIDNGTAGLDPDIQWCPTEFFDPEDLLGEGVRPPVYYAMTSSWMDDGSLALYWGTGSPYERYTSDTGYFFAVKDPTPLVCSAAEPIMCDGTSGLYELGAGEGLTADPIVWSGIVFFSTYQPDEVDRCSPGQGRVYGLWFEDCSAAIDLTGDGVEDQSVEVEGYPSQVAISDQGSIFIGTSDFESTTNGIVTITVSGDPLMETQTLSWMEVF